MQSKAEQGSLCTPAILLLHREDRRCSTTHIAGIRCIFKARLSRQHKVHRKAARKKQQYCCNGRSFHSKVLKYLQDTIHTCLMLRTTSPAGSGLLGPETESVCAHTGPSTGGLSRVGVPRWLMPGLLCTASTVGGQQEGLVLDVNATCH